MYMCECGYAHTSRKGIKECRRRSWEILRESMMSAAQGKRALRISASYTTEFLFTLLPKKFSATCWKFLLGVNLNFLADPAFYQFHWTLQSRRALSLPLFQFKKTIKIATSSVRKISWKFDSLLMETDSSGIETPFSKAFNACSTLFLKRVSLKISFGFLLERFPIQTISQSQFTRKWIDPEVGYEERFSAY